MALRRLPPSRSVTQRPRVGPGSAISAWRFCYCVLTQSGRAFCDPMDCSPPGSFVHGILQAGILEWVAISSSGGPSRPRGQSRVSCISCPVGGVFAAAPPGSPRGPVVTAKGAAGGADLVPLPGVGGGRLLLMSHGPEPVSAPETFLPRARGGARHLEEPRGLSSQSRSPDGVSGSDFVTGSSQEGTLA